jgi:hypothetical protein
MGYPIAASRKVAPPGFNCLTQFLTQHDKTTERIGYSAVWHLKRRSTKTQGPYPLDSPDRAAWW